MKHMKDIARRCAALLLAFAIGMALLPADVQAEAGADAGRLITDGAVGTMGVQDAAAAADTEQGDADDAAAADTAYTVQYYADLAVMAADGTNALPIIDTSGARLPANKGDTETSPTGNGIMYIYVGEGGYIQTEERLTEIYGSQRFAAGQTLRSADKLSRNSHYEPKAVWVLKDGRDAASDDPSDWEVYGYDPSLHIAYGTEPGAGDIPVNGGGTVRLVYRATENAGGQPGADIAADFYDYDISNGMIYGLIPTLGETSEYIAGDVFNDDGSLTEEIKELCPPNYPLYGDDYRRRIYTYTHQSGINSLKNYGSNGGANLAFGNGNTGTSFKDTVFSEGGFDNTLNRFNSYGYQGCTFGLVSGMEDGRIRYADGIDVPNLFGEGDAAGKTPYDDGQYSLLFDRSGDTYTLTAVGGTDTAELDKFGHPQDKYTHIWTNNFWPMDAAPSFGTGTHDVKFGGTVPNAWLMCGPSLNTSLPPCDDGKDHNSYFGMHFSVDFDLSADYVGPLEYCFFGDDDMWVFLDDTLVCDIGGVHRSVGEYVDLWDYLEEGDAGTHTLSVFYTERGASGSTCWIQFTLPGVFEAGGTEPAPSGPDYRLPDTGGMGAVPFMACGTAAMAAGLGVFLYGRRRRRAA